MNHVLLHLLIISACEIGALQVLIEFLEYRKGHMDVDPDFKMDVAATSTKLPHIFFCNGWGTHWGVIMMKENPTMELFDGYLHKRLLGQFISLIRCLQPNFLRILEKNSCHYLIDNNFVYFLIEPYIALSKWMLTKVTYLLPYPFQKKWNNSDYLQGYTYKNVKERYKIWNTTLNVLVYLNQDN